MHCWWWEKSLSVWKGMLLLMGELCTLLLRPFLLLLLLSSHEDLSACCCCCTSTTISYGARAFCSHSRRNSRTIFHSACSSPSSTSASKVSGGKLWKQQQHSCTTFQGELPLLFKWHYYYGDKLTPERGERSRRRGGGQTLPLVNVVVVVAACPRQRERERVEVWLAGGKSREERVPTSGTKNALLLLWLLTFRRRSG